MASSKTAKLERILPWGILGFGITAVGILITIAIFYFQESEGKVRATWLIRNEEKLVEVRENIKDLSILYQGKDILMSGQELRIVTLGFLNDGKSITQDMYDQNLAFGLRFPNSDIITGEVVQTSSKYLKDNLKLEIKASNLLAGSTTSNKIASDLVLPKLIFDHGSSFTLKVYLLNLDHTEPSQPVSLGKIADLDNLPVVSLTPVQSTDKNLWGALLSAVVSCFLGVAVYAFGLRVRAKAIAKEKDYMLEALRQELRDASQTPTLQDSKSSAHVENSSSKPVGPVESPPPV